MQCIPSVARASKRSKEEDVRKVFDEIVGDGLIVLTLDDLLSYLGDYLGLGQAEVERFYDQFGSPDGMTFERFRAGYALLNPFMVAQRSEELIIRKPGSLGAARQTYSPQQINLESLDDCEVYVCNPTAQVFVDFCKRCLILLGPCESSVFVRDCEDCVFWLAAQQLRTANCHRCTFHLYSKTEPIIEMSSEMSFAPWCAGYPGCTSHFAEIGFDPHRNLWNSVFDFSGEVCRSHWRILPLGEVVQLTLELSEPPGMENEPDSPGPAVTHAVLCAAPLASGESCGEGIANIPQSRPDLPPEPIGDVTVSTWVVRDQGLSRPVGLKALKEQASQS